MEDPTRSAALLTAQKNTLEMVVSGAPLTEVLTHLVRTVEEQAHGAVIASILLLDDDRRLRNGAAPSLPDDYLRAIDGIAADPNVGTCAAAAATGESVVTEDFANAPSWKGLSHLPLALGLKGAWSMPIRARDGSILGTFGTYFREIRRPTDREREVVAVLAHTASIAIERERAEAVLREREAFNRRLLESSADCIKVLDLQGRLLSMNQAGMRLMQLDDLRPLLSRPYTDFWKGDDRRAAERAIALAAAGAEGRFEGYCPTTSGEPKWWDVLITPIPGADDRPLWLLVVSRDVTERRRFEDALRAAMEQAEAASNAKSRFLAVMSHELRTPLTGIIGYTDLLAGGVSGDVTPRQLTNLERIRAGAWHLVSIIDQILTFSRLEAGAEYVMVEQADIASIVEECVGLLAPQAHAKGIGLRLDVPPEPLLIESDAGKLRQIVLNLVGNALKFTDEGHVDVGVRVEDGHIVLAVRDTGPGIAPELRESIFEPFVQADQSNTRTRGGTGLGLSVSRSLARLLGGDIELACRPGGTTFELRLPVERPAARLPEPATA